MELDLHVTNRCNLSCSHCIYEANDRMMDDISINVVKKILPDLKQMGVKEVHLTGGEPLLNEHIFKIIEFLKLEGFTVRVQSNGVLISNSVVEEFKRLKVDSVMVSVDGLKNSHNFFRGNNTSYKHAINAIELCLEAGIYTRVNTVLHKKNLTDVRELMVVLNNMGIDQHSFFYLSPGGRGTRLKDYMLSLKEWKNISAVIKQVSIDIGCSDRVKIQDLLVEKECDINECRIKAKDNCLILSNGNVYPCVFFVNSEFCLGNIFEESLLQIWNNDMLWEKYEQRVNKLCNNKNCMGGCIGMIYLLKGEIKTCDPRCIMREGLIPGCIRRYSVLECDEKSI